MEGERLDKKAAEDEARKAKEATGRAMFEKGIGGLVRRRVRMRMVMRMRRIRGTGGDEEETERLRAKKEEDRLKAAGAGAGGSGEVEERLWSMESMVMVRC
jgi:hypothetical protein